MPQYITTPQIRELLSIDQVRGGIGTEVQELIARLTSGGVAGKSDDPRLIQTKVLFDAGFGREISLITEMSLEKFDDYLATIPEEIPENPNAELFSPLVLVDPRLGVEKICDLLGIDCYVLDAEVDNLQPRPVAPYWMWANDGRQNRGLNSKDCRDKAAPGEQMLTMLEGLMVFAQNRVVLKGHAMDLAGSVHSSDQGGVGYLHWWYDRPWLSWYWDDSASEGFGAASRGSVEPSTS